MSACERDPYRNECFAGEPVAVGGHYLQRGFLLCRHYTCEDGLRVAKWAMEHGPYKYLEVQEEDVLVARFGTGFKSYIAAGRSVVVEGPRQGQIITQKTTGEYLFSPFWVK